MSSRPQNKSKEWSQVTFEVCAKTLEEHLLQIEEIGSDKKSRGIGGNTSRQDEVRRMAQSMAAERLASAQASNAGGQAVADKGQLQDDAVKLSTRALGQVSARNSADSMNRRDDLLSSLMDKLNNEILNPDSEFNQQKEKKKTDQTDGGQGGKSKKNKKIKQKAEWEPETQAGQIHPGRDVIGKVRVTKEVEETGGGANATGGVGSAGKAGDGKSTGKSGTPNYGKASDPKASESRSAKQQSQKSGKDEDKEAGEIAAAKGLEQSGLKAQGLEQQGKTGEKSKAQEQAGGAGGSSVKEFEVRTRATGTSQSLTVTPPKKLEKGDGFRKFRKLDDKPLLKYATMHKKKFQGGDNEEAIKELKKNARAAGESPEAIQQAVQRLKDRTTPDS